MGVDPISLSAIAALGAMPGFLSTIAPAGLSAMGSTFPFLSSILPEAATAAGTAAPLAPAIGATATEAASVPAWTAAAGSLPWSTAPTLGKTLGAAGKQFGMDTLKGIPINATNMMRQKLAQSQVKTPTSFQLPQPQSQAPPTSIFGDMRNMGQVNPYDQFMQNVFTRNPRV